MSSIAEVFQHMQPPQDVIETPAQCRDRCLEHAAFALYEARRAEFPEQFPLPWDLAPKSVRGDFRFMAMAAYRRSLPYVRETLEEMTAMQIASLDGYTYPGCDNKPEPDIYERDRPVRAAQRRQEFRHRARRILTHLWQYLEIDCDTEAQRKITVDRAGGQLMADRMIVSDWRAKKGIAGGPLNG